LRSPAISRDPAPGRTLILAIGKAAAAMASVATRKVQGSTCGLVVTRRGHSGPPHDLPAEFEVIEAGHPVPDAESLAAAHRALELARGLGPRDRLLMLVSGGGSALLALPVDGVTLLDKQAVTQALLRSGATIEEINSVRKHLSLVKGGRLAVAAAPAQVTTLIISDVPGDDPSFVASGPTVADATTLATAREILRRYRIEVPANVATALPARPTRRPRPTRWAWQGVSCRSLHSLRMRSPPRAGSRSIRATRSPISAIISRRRRGTWVPGHAALARRMAADGSRGSSSRVARPPVA
jgi:hydroxypyruvate reductase